MKILAFLIDAVYWLGLFIIPSGILFVTGMWFYFDNNNNLLFPITFGIAGVICGVALAEYIRKRYGLNNFWSGISTNLNMDKNNIADKKDEE